ncbi:MAG: FkbM family methyltransferase [Micropepsaceae bacterium]
MSIADLIFGIRRKRSRHKRILNAERDFHLALLDLKPGDITIDCGANVGLYTRFLARSGATVHAFEPDPFAFEELRKNTSMMPDVHLHQAAVGIADGEIELFRSAQFEKDPINRTVDSSIVPGQKHLSATHAIKVKLVSLPKFIANLQSPVSLLKMDIEGAEVEILEALIEGKATDQVRRAFVETHENTHKRLKARTFNLVRYAKAHLPSWNLDWA